MDSVGRLDDLPVVALQATAALVAADSFVWNHFHFATGRVESVGYPSHLFEPALTEAFAVHADEHPVLRHFRRTGDSSIHHIREFLSLRLYRATGLYCDCHRRLGYTDQAAGTIAYIPGSMVGIAIGRSRCFSAVELELVEILRRHLALVYERLWRRERSRELVRLGLGVGHLWLDDELRVAHWDDGARELLPALAARKLELGHPLPLDLTAKLPLRRHLAHSGKCVWGEAEVKAARNPETGRWVLGMRPVFAEGNPSPTRLTSREAEVLHWIRQGKTNAEIAIILAISANTVKNHVASILAKLQVETRGAASWCSLPIATSPDGTTVGHAIRQPPTGVR